MSTPWINQLLLSTSLFFGTALAMLLVLGGCDIGGGGGGGPATKPLPARSVYRPTPPNQDPVVRGSAVYKREGCILCHGEEGKGGVGNPNNMTGGLINGLTLIKEGYSQAQLIKKIEVGVDVVKRKDRNGPEPPYHMPAYKEWLTEAERDDLAAYLFSLYPKDRVPDDWDEDDEQEDE